jgi:polysaccharide export outer membrane protein
MELYRLVGAKGVVTVMFRSIFYFFALCLLVLSTPANCGVVGDYRLGTGDVLHITVYGQPDLTTDARVGDNGNITFPLIGEVKLKGVTPSEGELDIAARLKKGKFVLNPNVNLIITQYHGQQVSVLGRVNRPGQYTLDRISNVSDALALAGGIVADGADTITLIRHHNAKPEYLDIDVVALFKPGGASSDLVVGDGDIINVPRQPMFYIYGEVQRPGAFRLEQNMSVVQALSLGGGLTQRGTQRGIKILRRDPKGKMQELDTKLSDMVQKDDVIYVKESLF